MEIDNNERDALVERLLEATIGALELFSIHLGWRLGLYRTLADAGPLTVAELAAQAGIDERYSREWLEQQAVAGLLRVAAPVDDPDQRRFVLPPGHAEVLTDATSPAHVTPFAPMVVGIGGALPEVAAAYRSGAGVPYSRYGPDFRDGQGAINLPAFTHDLAGWLQAVPEIHHRLAGDPPAHVVEVGCGQGHATRALARAYPNAVVSGIDSDASSIADAARLGSDGVTFTVRDAAELADVGSYDLICIFEALHDMARPVEALVAARAALAPDGAVLVADERVADRFTAPGDAVERLMFGWSVSHCLPASRDEPDSAALGTALRASTVRDLGAAAGFGTVDVLPIENDFLRFYLLRP